MHLHKGPEEEPGYYLIWISTEDKIDTNAQVQIVIQKHPKTKYKK